MDTNMFLLAGLLYTLFVFVLGFIGGTVFQKR